MTRQLPPNYIDPHHPEEDRKLLACQAEGGTSDGVILRGLKAVDCPACEGTPKPGNQPCAVCGRPAPVPVPVAERLPSLAEISAWVDKCRQNPQENRWCERVDHHDVIAIARAALHDWTANALPLPSGEVGQ